MLGVQSVGLRFLKEEVETVHPHNSPSWFKETRCVFNKAVVCIEVVGHIKEATSLRDALQNHVFETPGDFFKEWLRTLPASERLELLMEAGVDRLLE